MRQTLVGETSTQQVKSRVLGWRWEWIAVGALVIAAFALRALTVKRGLPFIDNEDEPNPVVYVLRMLRTGDLNPHVFRKPTLYVYLLLPVLAAHYRWGVTTGLYPPTLDRMPLTTYVHTTVPGFFLWGRLLTVVVGTLTVIGVYVLGKRTWSRSAGLIAALFIATSPFHLRSSQYITFDVPSAAMVLLAYLAAGRVMESGRWRAYLLAGLLTGLAASIKYNAGAVATVVVAAHALYWGRKSLARFGRLIAAGMVAALGFVLGTPYALLDWPEFLRGLAQQQHDYGAHTHGDYTGAWPIAGYHRFFWYDGLRPAAYIAVIVGLLILLWYKRKAALLWLSFVVPYLLIHLAQMSHFNRNLMPIVVLCSLPVGVAGATVIESLSQRTPRLRPAVVIAVLLALFLPATVQALHYTQRLQRGDTRVQLSSWIEANVPPGVRVAAELKPVPGAGEPRWTEVHYLPEHDLAWYRRQGYQYVVGSSDTWRQWAIPQAYTRFAGRPPVATFGGDHPLDMLGPYLVVYDTGLSPGDPEVRPTEAVQFGGTRFLGVTLGQPDPKAPQVGMLPAASFTRGATLGLRTFWQIEQPLDADYFIFVHVLDAAGNNVAQRDAPPWLGRFPTSTWRAGTIVVDVNDLPLPSTMPSGDYTIEVGMFDPTTGRSPQLIVNGQVENGNSVRIATIKLQ